MCASPSDGFVVRSGRLIIIHNVNFTDASLGQRTGSDNDVRRLREVFQVLGFSVAVADDLRAYEMLQFTTGGQFAGTTNR